ncbi:hypothetical protein G7K_6196-t1 [Saitoella complicata NRRL Y-17804]|uniref:Uncharacterized protein n=1 Tax=Saitoella complicata (strain BCRC 22490 / CBS 7301 / JCM 7358 / NBRC 10748 / NRRL Y-17804) TaxID=698492 RepID=A0A0E9NRQ7_SAICN|nr:hypothetical protein G7K_6196-t1 [Saitoella complicata NRRL Y-17804]
MNLHTLERGGWHSTSLDLTSYSNSQHTTTTRYLLTSSMLAGRRRMVLCAVRWAVCGWEGEVISFLVRAKLSHRCIVHSFPHVGRVHHKSQKTTRRQIKGGEKIKRMIQILLHDYDGF